MNERWRVGLLLAVAMLVYANTLVNRFAFDDGYYVLDNPAVTASSLKQLFHPTTNNVFRPVMFATLAWNWTVEGARPFGYHLINILLHAVVTLLLYFLLRKLLDQVPRSATIAFAASLLFAVHPIHTEAAAWISGRAELLAAGFLLAAWLLHLSDRQIPALACYVLALLSKESAVSFLPLVLAGDYARGKLKPLYRYGLIAGASAVYLALLWNVQGGRFGEREFNPLDNPLASLSPGLRILNALRIAWKYVGLQIYPGTLSCDYSYNAILLYANWRVVPAAVATAFVLALWIWALRTGRKEWFLAGAIYLAGFMTTANILVPTGTIMGERLAYLPSAGFCLLVALIWIQLEERHRKLAWTVLAVALVLLSIRTVVRNRDWRDNFTLYSAAVRAVPGSTKAHALLGQEYLLRGQLDAARSQFKMALQIFPAFPEAIENYGLVEVRAGHDREARSLLEKALSLTKKSDRDYNYRALNLAAWLVQQGDSDGALKILNQVIADSPGEARAWSNRAVVLYKRGETAAARADAETALRLDPANSQAASLLTAVNAPVALAPAR